MLAVVDLVAIGADPQLRYAQRGRQAPVPVKVRRQRRCRGRFALSVTAVHEEDAAETLTELRVCRLRGVRIPEGEYHVRDG